MLLPEARFITLAERELEEAFDYYSAERPSLGVQFAECVEATLRQALSFPEGGTTVTHPRLRRTVRRFQVHAPFPYDLVATVVGAELVVVAVAHHKRKPTYWVRRATALR